jgi:hypothetical protein
METVTNLPSNIVLVNITQLFVDSVYKCEVYDVNGINKGSCNFRVTSNLQNCNAIVDNIFKKDVHIGKLPKLTYKISDISNINRLIEYFEACESMKRVFTRKEFEEWL